MANGVSGKNVVGYYLDASGRSHGFLYNGTTYSTIDPPGSLGANATAVSGNIVVGNYNDRSGGHTVGFLFDGSTYTTLDVPESTGTLVTGGLRQ